jgi:hypothetical protein
MRGFDSHWTHQGYIMTLDERVIQLHDIARQIEQELGSGSLSQDLRRSADRLHELIKKQDVRTLNSKLGYSRVGLDNV